MLNKIVLNFYFRSQWCSSWWAIASCNPPQPLSWT